MTRGKTPATALKKALATFLEGVGSDVGAIVTAITELEERLDQLEEEDEKRRELAAKRRSR